MDTMDHPVVVVVPGDLHLTEPDLDNAWAAFRVVDDVNRLIRPDFVQFIGDNVQHATGAQFRLFDEIRGRLKVPHFAMIGERAAVLLHAGRAIQQTGRRGRPGRA